MGRLIDSLRCTSKNNVPMVLRNRGWDGKNAVATLIANLEGGSGRIEGAHWVAHGTWSKELSVPARSI